MGEMGSDRMLGSFFDGLKCDLTGDAGFAGTAFGDNQQTGALAIEQGTQTLRGEVREVIAIEDNRDTDIGAMFLDRF
ncbi:hypothetical protein NG799_21290 [Laspinema sp. D1]|uniref:Uncharacterized protein n=2 Tax=Laspinema TaxID=2584823 RepID=A0ABT2MVR8_9CYAN|nr:hypothetical protein [Laspinema sp. D2a]